MRMNVVLVFTALLAYAVLAAPPAARAQEAPSATTASAIFAGGCFWCMEPPFDAVPGVISTTVGYTGGETKNPTYEQVSGGSTGHTEAIQIVYDPTKVSYEQLLEVFWRNVDALDGGGQFCDRGSQYRSAIFFTSEEEQRQAEASKQAVAKRLVHMFDTQIFKANPFYSAETDHKDYYKKNPIRYKFYKWNCGREQRLEKLWGKRTFE